MWYRYGDRIGFYYLLVCEALPPCAFLLCFLYRMQEQGSGVYDDNQNRDNIEECIVNTGDKLRDVKPSLCTLVSALQQVFELELFDHGLAVGADLIGHVVDVHGIKGVKVAFEDAVVIVFFGRLIRFALLFILMPGGRCPG